MGKSSKKPRQKFDPRKITAPGERKKKEDDDWSFEDIVRSKKRHR